MSIVSDIYEEEIERLKALVAAQDELLKQSARREEELTKELYQARLNASSWKQVLKQTEQAIGEAVVILEACFVEGNDPAHLSHAFIDKWKHLKPED